RNDTALDLVEVARRILPVGFAQLPKNIVAVVRVQGNLVEEFEAVQDSRLPRKAVDLVDARGNKNFVGLEVVVEVALLRCCQRERVAFLRQPKRLLRTPQRLLGTFAIGDVADRSGPADRLARVVARREEMKRRP